MQTDIQLFLGDCLKGMKKIPDKSINAIICDLPYGTTCNKWDCILPFEALWEQYERIITDNGAIVLFTQMPFTAKVVASNYPLFKYEIIWVKNYVTGHLNANFAPLKTHENILIFSKAAAAYSSNCMTYNPQKTKCRGYVSKSNANNTSSNYGKQKAWENIITESCPIDVVEFPRDPDRSHPTQKPVNLLRYLIRTYTNAGETVLDNCMGSGTTAVACVMEERNFIGFEIVEDYYNIAVNRVKLAQQEQQSKLFDL